MKLTILRKMTMMKVIDYFYDLTLGWLVVNPEEQAASIWVNVFLTKTIERGCRINRSSRCTKTKEAMCCGSHWPEIDDLECRMVEHLSLQRISILSHLIWDWSSWVPSIAPKHETQEELIQNTVFDETWRWYISLSCTPWPLWWFDGHRSGFANWSILTLKRICQVIMLI